MNKRNIKWTRVLILLLCCVIVVGVPGYFIYQHFNPKETVVIPPVDETPEAVKVMIENGYPEETALQIYQLTSSDKRTYLLESTYDKKTTDILLNQYSDFSKLDRYLQYANDQSLTDIYLIVLSVNLNLDYEFYENTTKVSNPTDLLVVVNKYNQLSEDFKPTDLVAIRSDLDGRSDGMQVLVRAEVADAFYAMNAAMESDIGLIAKGISGFRDYDYQAYLYNYYVSTIGVEKADLESARPGYSEHQTGWVLDVNANGQDIESFKYSEQSDWVIEHAHEYGFIVRYHDETTHITGYRAEEWHLRYVGIEAATSIYNQGITLEEYVMRINHE